MYLQHKAFLFEYVGSRITPEAAEQLFREKKTKTKLDVLFYMKRKEMCKFVVDIYEYFMINIYDKYF